jgi:hypothetical protein
MEQVQGVDFSSQAAHAVAASLKIPIHLGQLAALYTEGNAVGKFDVITMWWYLEHVPDPAEIIKIAFGLLNPGGILAMGIPSADALTFRLFGSRWFHLDPPRHLSIPSHSAIRHAIGRAGLNVQNIYEDLSPWGILGSLEYAFRGRINNVDHSLVANRAADIILRPLSISAAVAGKADCIAVYAVKPQP